MANITLRRNVEPSLAPIPSLSSIPSAFPALSSFPSVFGRLEPFRLMENLLRWDPFQEMAPAFGNSGLAFSPDFEVEETQDRYVFSADLPGMTESDIDITLSGNRLTISGKREVEQKEQTSNYYCRERSYGSFSRSFTLPVDAELDHIKADLKNGVLTVVVAKTAEAQPRKISLQAGQSKDSNKARA